MRIFQTVQGRPCTSLPSSMHSHGQIFLSSLTFARSLTSFDKDLSQQSAWQAQDSRRLTLQPSSCASWGCAQAPPWAWCAHPGLPAALAGRAGWGTGPPGSPQSPQEDACHPLACLQGQCCLSTRFTVMPDISSKEIVIIWIRPLASHAETVLMGFRLESNVREERSPFS